MSPVELPESALALARELVEELLRTGLALTDALSSLIEDMPADAFPGEDTASVLVEMAAGTCTPAVMAAGEANCRESVALIGAVRDRFITDLIEAARIAEDA